MSKQTERYRGAGAFRGAGMVRLDRDRGGRGKAEARPGGVLPGDGAFPR